MQSHTVRNAQETALVFHTPLQVSLTCMKGRRVPSAMALELRAAIYQVAGGEFARHQSQNREVVSSLNIPVRAVLGAYQQAT